MIRLLTSLRFRVGTLIHKPLLRRLGYKYNRVNHPYFYQSQHYANEHPLRSLINLHDGYLRESGWLESKNQNSSILHESPVPWMSFAFLHILSVLNLKDAALLEFGGGNSTFYFSSLCRTVRTVEFDADFQISLTKRAGLQSNITVIDGSKEFFSNINEECLLEFSDVLEEAYNYDVSNGVMNEKLSYDFKKYCSVALSEIESSDICFVDGGYRNLQLALFAFSRNKPLLIVDNADFDNLAYGLAYLRNCKLLEIPFRGLGPLNPYSSTTTIFSDPNPEGKSSLYRYLKQD